MSLAGRSSFHELRVAPRWDAEPYLGKGLHDGLQVAVHPSVASDLEVGPDEVPLLEQAIESAFGKWENDALWFEIEHESPLAIRGEGVGAEIDLFTVPGIDPLFAGTSYFGVTYVTWGFVPARLLSNGRRESGFAIAGADIFLNATLLLQTKDEFGLPIGILAFALTRLLGDEIGHALGLGHRCAGRCWFRSPRPESRLVCAPRRTPRADPDGPAPAGDRRLGGDAADAIRASDRDPVLVRVTLRLLARRRQSDSREGQRTLMS